jgi:nucleoside-diphosphate kinase
MEQTLLIIKPDAVERNLTGDIIKRVEEKGFKMIKLKMFTFSLETAKRFYEIHKEKPFFDELVEYITSSRSVAALLERENAVAFLREIVGKTDPLESPPHTIRRCYGIDIQKNSVHASDSMENAKKEISIIFG